MDALINKNNKDMIKLLINNGADVNAINNDGYTPLMVALSNNYDKDIIELLINNGADVNAINDYWNTPLIYALTSINDKDIIQLLLDNGADNNLETLKEKLKESDYKTEMLLFIDEY
jgi:ankyrin repeat protein